MLAVLPTSQIAKRGISGTTEYLVQFKADTMLSDDPAQLLPQLLDQLIALGDMARQISHALGGNGHRPEVARELIEELAKR